MLSVILKEDIPICPQVCLLGGEVDGVKSAETQHLLTLAFLSVKRIILMNWKVRKLNCFCLHNWLKDFVELIMMKRAASTLQGLYTDGLVEPWTLIREYIKKLHLTKVKNFSLFIER